MWEYKTEITYYETAEFLTDFINEQAHEGWILVVMEDDDTGLAKVCVFKRKIKPTLEEFIASRRERTNK